MAQYRFIARDLKTGLLLGELPLSDVQYEKALNDSGAFSAKLVIPVDDPALARLYRYATTPQKVAVYVERDGNFEDGYIIYGRQTDGFSFSLSGASLWSYYRRRFLKYTHGITTTVVGNATVASTPEREQMDIARDFITDAEDHGAAFAPVFRGSATGVTRVVVVLPSDLKQVADAIETMAEQDSGFDFALYPEWASDGSIRHVFETYYPQRGRSYALDSLVCDLEQHVESWTWVDDRSNSANSVIAIGAGEGQSMLYQTANGDATGVLTFESTLSYKDVTDATVLYQLALGGLAFDKNEIVPSVTLSSDADLIYGSYGVGDIMRIRLNDGVVPAFPDGIDVQMRVKSLSVSVDASGSDKITVQFSYVTQTAIEGDLPARGLVF